MTESDLAHRVASLDLPADEFRAAGHALVDRMADLFASAGSRPVTSGVPPPAVRAALGEGPLPPDGAPAGRIVDEATRLLLEHSLFNGHPRFWGYITGSPAPIGALADFLAAAVNANCGAWELSPVGNAIEEQTVRWIAELVGYPQNCGGLLVSGGNVANFVCFLAARRAKAGESIRKEGLEGGEKGKGRLLVYAATETHTWLQKAADIFGHGTDAIRWIPVDALQRMDVTALRETVRRDRSEGNRPFLAVGSAGTVGTGAIDPMREIAEVCREEDLWFHADGAYGAPAAALPDAPEDLRAVALAAALALAPHPGHEPPLEAGCVLVRDRAALPAAFAYTPTYYAFDEPGDEPPPNYYALGLQNSRGLRALKVWMGLRQAGRSGYVRMIQDDCRLAGRLAEAVAASVELELLTHSLSITTFRYAPARLRGRGPDGDAALDTINETLLRTLKRGGEAFVSNVRVGGRYALRACIVNFRTTLPDVQALPEIVVRLGRLAEKEAEKKARS